MDKNRRENSLFSCLFLYRSRKTDCFPVCYTKIDRKTDWLAMGIFPALFLSKTWPYNGFLEPCFLALRLGNVMSIITKKLDKTPHYLALITALK